jgi:hypothetical protein
MGEPASSPIRREPRIELRMIGQFLAHYEITGLLGKGGMGEV